MIALLCLLFGQRLAKDYGGASVLAAYFAFAVVGIILVS
jgi:diacylglycerol kinase